MDAATRNALPGRGLFAPILAAAATVGFYVAVEQPVLRDTVIHRYTTGHPIEYVAVAMFLWAAVDLLVKAVGLTGERAALRRRWLPSDPGPLPASHADRLYEAILNGPRRHAGTLIGRRLAGALRYVREKRSAQGLEDYLHYLAEQAADLGHRQFALVRVIAWMIPILGFLGTVMGITIAIANISPEQLEGSLTDVTSGLAVAFDTTAMALTLSILLMLLAFVVEKSQQQLLMEVEGTAHDLLAHRFHVVDQTAVPYLEAVQATGDVILSHARQLVEEQAAVWARTIQKQDEAVQATLAAIDERAHQQAKQNQIGADRLLAVQQEMHRIAEGLYDVIDRESRLVDSQQRLAENLRLIEHAENLDSAMHTLSGAIHLLVARRGTDKASGEKAA